MRGPRSLVKTAWRRDPPQKGPLRLVRRFADLKLYATIMTEVANRGGSSAGIRPENRLIDSGDRVRIRQLPALTLG